MLEVCQSGATTQNLHRSGIAELLKCCAGNASQGMGTHHACVPDKSVCHMMMKVSRMEFVLLWATFVAIMLTDLERGIGIGIIMAVLYFAYSYAQARTASAASAFFFFLFDDLI